MPLTFRKYRWIPPYKGIILKLLVSFIFILNSSLAWALPDNEGSDTITGSYICKGDSSSDFNDCSRNPSSKGFCVCINHRDRALYPDRTKAQRMAFINEDLEDTHHRLAKSLLLNDAAERVNLKKKQIENLHELADQIGVENFSCINKDKLLDKMHITKEIAETKRDKAPPWVELYHTENNIVPNQTPVAEKGFSDSDKRFLLHHLSFVFGSEKVAPKALSKSQKRQKNKDFFHASGNLGTDQDYSDSVLYQIFSSNNGFAADKYNHAISAWIGYITKDSGKNENTALTPIDMIDKISNSGELQKSLGHFLDGACERLNFLVEKEIDEFKKKDIETAKLKISSDLKKVKDEDAQEWSNSIDDLNRLIRLQEENIDNKQGDNKEERIIELQNNVDRLYCREYEKQSLSRHAMSYLSPESQKILFHKMAGIEQTAEEILALEKDKQNLRLECPRGTKEQIIARRRKRDPSLTTDQANQFYAKRFPKEKIAKCKKLETIDDDIKTLADKQKEALKFYERSVKEEFQKYFNNNHKNKEVRELLISFGVSEESLNNLSPDRLGDVFSSVADTLASEQIDETVTKLSEKDIAAGYEGFVKEKVVDTYRRIKNETKRIDSSSLSRASSSKLNKRAESLKEITRGYSKGQKPGMLPPVNKLAGTEEIEEGQKKWYDGIMDKPKKVEQKQQQVAQQSANLIPSTAKEVDPNAEKEKAQSDLDKRELDLKKMLASLIDSKKNDSKESGKGIDGNTSSSKKSSSKRDLEMEELKRQKIQLEIANLNLEKERLRLADDVGSIKKNKSETSARTQTSEVVPTPSPKALSFAGEASGTKESKKPSTAVGQGQGQRAITSGANSSASSAGGDSGGTRASNALSTSSFTLTQTDPSTFNRELAMIEVKDNILKLPLELREAYIQNLFKDRKDNEILIKLPNGEIIKIEKDSLKKIAEKKKLKVEKKREPAAELRERFKVEDLEGHLAPVIKEQ